MDNRKNTKPRLGSKENFDSGFFFSPQQNIFSRAI